MKKIMKFFIYFILMLAIILFFVPKVNVYYLAETFMKQKNIYISDEDIYDNGFSLELVNAKIFFDKLELMKIDTIKFSPWIVYNSIRLDVIDINEGFSDFLPRDLSFIEAKHVFYNPTQIMIRGESQDSSLFGEIDFIERVVRLHFRIGVKSEKKYKNLLSKLTKEEGGYYFEYKL
ncbi:hypothetical protein JHD50_00035 [Sulfurimonas sp. MAG313]|nr:hypothetical protein [Sulfurimonas sp. MAG313]MDF1879703.1 hypothetical protein [Sulfurimonas sp. MAG313]